MPRTLRATFGTSREDGDIPVCPEGYGCPEDYLGVSGAGLGRDDVLRVVAFEDAGLSFLTTRRTGVTAAYVRRVGAHTRGGVAIGDRLSTARKRYPQLRCREDQAPENSETWPVCAMTVGTNTISFGEDPIRSISIEALTLGSVTARPVRR